ncbi:MAG: glycosyltransferase [Chthoniobacterales bacterium]
MDKPNILLVSTSDRVGGAEQMALSLLDGYCERGCKAALAVGTKTSARSEIYQIPKNRWRQTLDRATLALVARRVRVLPQITHQLSRLGDLRNEVDRRRGLELFHYPGTRELLSLAPFSPRLVHAHNLHRDYFDLRFLPELSARLPLVITLHDAWLLSGHCAHSFACERWKIGCGECPDLTIPPAIERDGTAENWRRKREIFQRSRFYVAAPCQWLVDKLASSMVASAVIESRVIPNGIDLDVFKPGDRETARAALGLPQEADILLFTALSIRGNVWKDYETLRSAIARLAERRSSRPLIFLAIGEDAPDEQMGASATIRFVPFMQNNARLATFYQAADLYLHAARADTFPTSILEALACETPVVATAVGGIPEQIAEGETGLLTPPGDAAAMAGAIASLLDAPDRRRAMGMQAGVAARTRFGRDRMVEDYLNWFREILSRPAREVPAA